MLAHKLTHPKTPNEYAVRFRLFEQYSHVHRSTYILSASGVFSLQPSVWFRRHKAVLTHKTYYRDTYLEVSCIPDYRKCASTFWRSWWLCKDIRRA